MQTLFRLCPGESLWPLEFDCLDPRPLRIWGRGLPALLAQRPRVAVVGTRSPTPYGQQQAQHLGRVLARAGVVVVSGLARGIDELAHQAALDEGGGSIALLGSGVDRVWPDGPLARRMTQSGLLLSEFEPGTPPAKHHFPLRNRLIAALAQAVVVVEAAYRSGSLITAHWGCDLGRPVFAIPGRVDHPMARGCHRLIREGAELLEEPRQVLECLGLELAKGAGGEPPKPAALGGMEQQLMQLLLGETLRPEELALGAGRPLGEVLAGLARLQLDGLVVRSPGGLYRRSLP